MRHGPIGSGGLSATWVDFIGRTSYLKNKRATGRPQDLAHAAALDQIG